MNHLCYSSSVSTVLGVDLGGTKADVALFDSADFSVVAEKRMDTHASQNFDRVFEDLVTALTELRQKDTVAVGVGVPGLVTQPQQVVLTMPNIPRAMNIELKTRLEESLSIPVVIDNDANCFTLAEALHGTGKDKRIVVGMTLGTGVGGGIVIDGKIFHGSKGYAGEIGHMLLQPGQPPYETDDMRGEVEQFFSGSAMGKRCEAAGKPEDYLEGAVCEFMRPDVFREIAWTCVNLTHLLDPDIIVFGGSAGLSLKGHLPEIEKEILKWMLPGTPIAKMAVSTNKNGATLGAALLTQ